MRRNRFKNLKKIGLSTALLLFYSLTFGLSNHTEIQKMSKLSEIKKSETEHVKPSVEKEIELKVENIKNETEVVVDEIKHEQKDEKKSKNTQLQQRDKKTKLQIVNIPTKSLMPTVNLNVRNEAGTVGTKVINNVKKHNKVTVNKQTTIGKTTWYYSENYKGWLSGAYLTDYKKVEQPKTITTNQSTTSKYKPMHIYYGNKAVPYKNGGKSQGQSIIDKTHNASTWGGAPVFSGTDGMNTHLIGHNGGKNQFGGMHNHSVFIVTDGQGNAFKYVRTAKYVVNEYGVRTDTGQNMFDRIAGSGGGERIVLQNTKKHPLKWIVEAEFAGKVN